MEETNGKAPRRLSAAISVGSQSKEPYPLDLFMDSGPALRLQSEGTARADAEEFLSGRRCDKGNTWG